MRARPRYQRTSNPDTGDAENTGSAGKVEVPVVLPHVVFTVHDDDTMTVAVDGETYEPEPFAPPWQRGSFPAVLDALTDQRRTPIRVEVREADGTVFTDIITPARHRAAEPEPSPPTGSEPAVRLVALHGEGFVPGEDVAIAVIVAYSDAAPDGTARGLLTAAELAHTPTGEVALIGSISGTTVVGRPES